MEVGQRQRRQAVFAQAISCAVVRSAYLRKALAPDGGAWIVNVPLRGYMFRARSSTPSRR